MSEIQAEFELLPDDGTGRDSFGRIAQRPPVSPGRAGTHNVDKKVAWKLAHLSTPAIMEKMVALALKPETEIGFRAAQLILSRTFPKPRNAPLVEFSMTGGGTLMERLLQGLEAGELTAPDVAALARALENYGGPANRQAGDARDVLRERIMKVIAARRAETVALAELPAMEAAAVNPPDEGMDEIAEMEQTLRQLEGGL